MYIESRQVWFGSPREGMGAGIATVYQHLAMIPLMSVTRNFWMGREPRRTLGPLLMIDFETAYPVTMHAMLYAPRHSGGYVHRRQRCSMNMVKLTASQAPVCDARLGLEELSRGLGDWRAPEPDGSLGVEWRAAVDEVTAPPGGNTLPSDRQG